MTYILMTMMNTNIILEKRASLIIGKLPKGTFNKYVKHTIDKKPGIDTEETNDVTFDKVEPRYRA